MITLRRKYSLSDIDLLTFVTNLIGYMQRDIQYFATRGVSDTDIVALIALKDEFFLFPSDSFYNMDISIAAQAKLNIRSHIIVDVRNIMDSVIFKWGEGSPQYNRFGIYGFANQTDREFIATTLKVITVATKYLPELSEYGLTMLMIDSLAINVDLFESNLNSVIDMCEQRELKTHERIILGNKLYSFVSKYARMGKLIWDDVNAVKYNNYIIHPNASQSSKKALPV